ncbi:helix-turn-helix domain-containing protein [Azotobacter armeniacus]
MNKRQIQARLIEHGSNFRQFALAHGYEPRTVTQAVQRWAGAKTLPNGRLTFSILRDLSLAIGTEVLPGILEGMDTNGLPQIPTALER